MSRSIRPLPVFAVIAVTDGKEVVVGILDYKPARRQLDYLRKQYDADDVLVEKFDLNYLRRSDDHARSLDTVLIRRARSRDRIGVNSRSGKVLVRIGA